jgi:hypothetical protein
VAATAVVKVALVRHTKMVAVVVLAEELLAELHLALLEVVILRPQAQVKEVTAP